MTLEPGAARRPALPPFYFLVTYWGDAFRHFLCKFTIPSLFATGNIPALRYPKAAKFLFCTTRADWEALQKEPVFAKLSELIAVEFLENDEVPGEHKYVRMSRGHQMLSNACFRDGAIAININPDSIYPDGCISEAQRYALDGKRVVLCTAIRFDQDGIEAELESKGMFRGVEPLALSMREAVDIGLRHLHSESQAAVWGASNFGRLAPQHGRHHLLTCCIWMVPDRRSCIIVTHNWAPFMVNYGSLAKHDTSTLDGRAIDGDYIYENFGIEGLGDTIYVVEDSDSIFLLGMTPRDDMVPPAEDSPWKRWPVVKDWTFGYILNRTVFDPAIDPMRRKLYATGVKWHAEPIDENWGGTLATFARHVDAYVARDLAPNVERPRSLRDRWFRFIHDALFDPPRWEQRMAEMEKRLPAFVMKHLRSGKARPAKDAGTGPT